MMIISKLKEALICIKAGKVTLPYPFAPRVPEDGFRGRVVVDAEKCIGCAGCAEVCPPRLIEVTDVTPELRVLEFSLERCTYCARCSEVCPEQAITVTKEFEQATTTRQDLHMRVEVFMSTCRRCGRCFEPPSPFDRMMVTGMRAPANGDEVAVTSGAGGER
jgi:hydrogenase-4 component H